jgi:hypothetical protein
MRNRTKQASMVILKIIDMLKRGSRFMTYYGITHRLTSHKVTNIITKYIYDDGAFNGRVWQWDKIIVDSQGLKRGHFLRFLLWSKIGPFTDHKKCDIMARYCIAR